MKSIAKPSRRRVATFLGIGSIVVLAATGCGSSSPASENSGLGGVLTTGVPLTVLQPINFDPVKMTISTQVNFVGTPLYSGLLRYTPDGTVVPDLASSVTVENPTTVNVQLRPGTTFSDGTPFDANAVKIGLERNINTTNKAAFNSLLYTVSSIDVTGTDSLVIHLSKPVGGAFRDVLATEASYIVPPAAATSGTQNSNPIGAGPFMFKSSTPQKIELVKNPRYWDAKNIKISQLNFVNLPLGPQQANAIQSGLVNVVQLLPVSDYSSLQDSGSVNLSIGTLPNQNLGVALCKSSGPLANPAVRQALYYATNRPAINGAVFAGKGEVMHGLFSSNSPLYNSKLADTYPYDLQKAKQLLAQAGYANGFSLTLTPYQGNPVTQQVAEILQSEWKQVGVDLKIVTTTDYVTDFLKNRKTDTGVQGFQTGLAGAVTYTPDGGLGNLCGYNDPKMTSLRDQIYAASSGTAQAKSLWDEAQAFINDNALAVYIVWIPAITVSSKTVHNLKLIPYGSFMLDVWGVSVTG